MTKPLTSWSGISKNDTEYEVNRDLQAGIDSYDSATDSYDGGGTSNGIDFYDGYDATSGSLDSTKKDTSWTP